MNRVPDVGNPWLDAGIVPYSTMGYNEDREKWNEWFPAELVLECFPGQFRNWFYALLSMSTMMENRPPFKTLLGHALVRDEKGQEMHKSKGTAIWFDDAVEEMGADIMRWIYCSQDTTRNLNFGYGVGREVRGRFINTFWNTYAFFVNYANVSGYDPDLERTPVAERSDLDRWIISRLQQLIEKADFDYRDFNVRGVAKAVEEFVELLSNWYVRRSRRRFWKGIEELDGRAAHDTLYEVLSTITRLISPIIPFLMEEIHQNMKLKTDPESIHLTSFPKADATLIDENLTAAMDAVARINSMALAARKQKDLRVRQPLAELIIYPADKIEEDACNQFTDIFVEELNIKKVTVMPVDSDMPVTLSIKAKFKVLAKE
jgi:isoleucyl-tRNA synthetase